MLACLEGSPDVSAVLRCEDVVKYYEWKNRAVVGFFESREAAAGVIDALNDNSHRDTQRTAETLMTTKTNRCILKVIVCEDGLMERLVMGIERGQFTTGLVCRVLTELVDVFSDECFGIFEKSRIIYRMFIDHISYVSVHSFLCSLMERQVDVLPLCWIILRVLIGNRVVLPSPPTGCDYECVVGASDCKCDGFVRPMLLELISIFAGVFMSQREVLTVIAEHLPYLMEMACDDKERKWVFVLGTLVPDNAALCKCAVSVIESFQSPQFLIAAAIEYVVKMSRTRDVLSTEQLVVLTYRLFTQKACNFLYTTALKLLEFRAKEIVQDERIRGILEGSRGRTIEERGFMMALKYYAGDEEWQDLDSKEFLQRMKTYKLEMKEQGLMHEFDVISSGPPRFDAAWMLDETQ